MPSWPTQSDYKDALQNPDAAFRDPELQRSAAERSPMGVPRARSGAFASVYKMTGPKGVVALKLFNFPNDDRARRYKAVSDYLERTLGPKKPPCLVTFQYHAEGIRVGKTWYPTLTMPWVRGVSLGEWLRQTVERKVPDLAGVRRMADRWTALVEQLQAAEVAHGDLQHDNVMVVNDAPVLVDYDGMCVPALDPADPRKKLEQLEFGKPAYQHPGRAAERLGARLDHFAAWAILVALRAVAADPRLYVEYVLKTDNENLLFTPADMQRPAESTLWPELLRSPDPEVADWAAALRASLDKPFSQIPPFSLDPFGRLRKLVAAPARDWSAIEAETVRLRAAGKDVPADLRDRADPARGIKELCDARVKDWERIAAEGAAYLASGRPLRTELARTVDEARKRVAARDAVRKGLDARNPRAAAVAYQPALVDDWADAALLAGARAAAALVAMLDELKAAAANPGDGRALVVMWDRYSPKLAGVPEAQPFADAANGWRARIDAATDFLQAYAKNPPDERVLADAWQAVLKAGPPHPRLTDAHRRRGEDAGKWWPVLARLRRVADAPSFDNDAELLAAWGNGMSLVGCPEAAAFVPRVADARVRLTLVEAVDRAVRQADLGGPEDAVTAAAAKLPPHYAHPHVTRVSEGSEAIRLVADLRRAAEAPNPSDRAIAAAYDKLKARNLRFAARLGMVDPALFQAAEDATARRKLLDRFARIDSDEPRADRQDRQWLALWAEHGRQLVERADREELRVRLTLARDRSEKWAKVAAALAAGDMFALRKRMTAYAAVLKGYPPLVKRADDIEELLSKVDRVTAVTQKLAAGSPLTADDMEFLRANHGAFDPAAKAALEAQVRARLAGDARLVPAHPALAVTGTRGGLVKARWAWGGHGLISHCVVAIDAQRFLADPDEADPFSRVTCQPENYQREGGGWTLVPPAGAAQAYVTIWPVVELGWKSVTGPPLTVGPVPLGAGAASAAAPRW